MKGGEGGKEGNGGHQRQTEKEARKKVITLLVAI